MGRGSAVRRGGEALLLNDLLFISDVGNAKDRYEPSVIDPFGAFLGQCHSEMFNFGIHL